VGVAYRFLQVLYESYGRTLPEDEFIDLVALGTVVDVAPSPTKTGASSQMG
jgi:single-stranded DNA-specific DHH superfamily exonuclease